MFFLIWIFTSNLTKKQEIHFFIMLNLAAFRVPVSDFRNSGESETRFTRFSYILYILNIPGPDLVLQGMRTQLQSGYFMASYSQNDASGCLAGRVICWSPFLLDTQTSLLSKYSGKCGRCEYITVCGGCRARAYATHGDYLSEEPLCTYIPPH